VSRFTGAVLEKPIRGLPVTNPKDNILCAGIIPGLKKPWDADSFIYPLVHELLELAIGTSAYDGLSRIVLQGPVHVTGKKPETGLDCNRL
jgi:hypothetical protein